MSLSTASRAGKRVTHPRLIRRGGGSDGGTPATRAASHGGRDEDVTSIWKLDARDVGAGAPLAYRDHGRDRDDTEVDAPIAPRREVRAAPPPPPAGRRAPRASAMASGRRRPSWHAGEPPPRSAPPPSAPWDAGDPTDREDVEAAGGHATFGAAAAWSFDDERPEPAVPGLARLPVRPPARPARSADPEPWLAPLGSSPGMRPAALLRGAPGVAATVSPRDLAVGSLTMPAIGAPLGLPRAGTAIEPAAPVRPAGRRRGQARAVALALVSAVLVAATSAYLIAPGLFGGDLLAARQIAAALGPDDAGDEGVLAERLTRVAVAPLDATRAFHPRTAAFRDRWRDSTWFHPLTGEELLPHSAMRKFGARRPGKRPTECGRGHCGVDLGDFGMKVSAAQGGVVERVARKSRDRAGKYVRIAHDDGFVSYYIHLHTIRPDLEVGMRIEAGDPIGVVGRSGIKRSPPHLHFALAYREAGKLFFVDPEPMLRHSQTELDAGDEAELDVWAAGERAEAAGGAVAHAR